MSRYYPIPVERLLALLLRRTAYGCAEFESSSPFRGRIAASAPLTTPRSPPSTARSAISSPPSVPTASPAPRTPETAHDRAH